MTPISPTPEQQAVIDLQEGAYLVTAPPGSGKTTVLTSRILRLLRESPKKPFQILALTFTTKAAEEMKARIEAEVGEEWRRVLACTFHAFCLDVLRHYGERVGIDSNITIYESDADRFEVLVRGLEDDGHRVIRRRDEEKALRSVLTEIGRLKRELVPHDAAPEELVAGFPLKEAYAAYDRTLRLCGAVDFDDLLLLTNQLFTEHERVAQHYRRLFRYVLVDEAQDMSLAQYEVLSSLLGEEHRNVLLVADEDQSIYGFAGASRGFLERYLRDFHAQRLPLRSNFRCATSIVEVANRLIRHNPDRAERPEGISAAMGARGRVVGRQFPTEEDEARGIADCIEDLLAGGFESSYLAAGENPALREEEICILARSRYALRAIKDELEERRIDFCFGTGEAGLFESDVFRSLLMGLRVLANPRDVMSKAKLLALLGRTDIESDSELAEAPMATFFQGLGSCGAGWGKFAPLFQAVISEENNQPQLVDSLVKLDLGWVEGENARDLARFDQELLATRWRAHGLRVGASERSIRGLLGELALAGRSAIDGAGIRVLSIHAVKGLEFRAVVVAGMNEGVFPDFRAETLSELQEERRNAYVAVTRASRFLLLTRPCSRVTSYGNIRTQEPSRFLSEMEISMIPA